MVTTFLLGIAPGGMCTTSQSLQNYPRGMPALLGVERIRRPILLPELHRHREEQRGRLPDTEGEGTRLRQAAPRAQLPAAEVEGRGHQETEAPKAKRRNFQVEPG